MRREIISVTRTYTGDVAFNVVLKVTEQRANHFSTPRLFY